MATKENSVAIISLEANIEIEAKWTTWMQAENCCVIKLKYVGKRIDNTLLQRPLKLKNQIIASEGFLPKCQPPSKRLSLPFSTDCCASVHRFPRDYLGFSTFLHSNNPSHNNSSWITVGKVPLTLQQNFDHLVCTEIDKK